VDDGTAVDVKVRVGVGVNVGVAVGVNVGVEVGVEVGVDVRVGVGVGVATDTSGTTTVCPALTVTKAIFCPPYVSAPGMSTPVMGPAAVFCAVSVIEMPGTMLPVTPAPLKTCRWDMRPPSTSIVGLTNGSE